MPPYLSPSYLWHSLRNTYWFLPALVTGTAMALAIALTGLDRATNTTPDWLTWAYGGGADGARALLSAVAGSMITVVSVTFSVTMVAITVSSQHFGPRVLNNFVRDTAAQLVLGTFIGTFAYCLLVLRTVQGDGDNYARFVPHFAVTGAVVLSLLSVAVLIFYVHHVSVSLRISNITQSLSQDLDAAVDRLYPAAIGQAAPAVGPEPAPVDGLTVTASTSGYVQHIDGDLLMRTARHAGVTVWTSVTPGRFVNEGDALAIVFPYIPEQTQLVQHVRNAYIVGPQRTVAQDPAMAVQQLVEVALRALSPGVNEPYTALTSIDRVGQGLVRLARRQIPSANRYDEQGRLRVVSAPETFVSLLQLAFEPLVVFAGPNPAIYRRLLEVLFALAAHASRAEDREAIRQQADAILDTFLKSDVDARFAAAVRQQRDEVLTRLSS